MLQNFKKYWYWYVLAVLALTYVIISLIRKEWNPLNWFSTVGGRKGQIGPVSGQRIGSRCVCGTPCCSCGTGDKNGEINC